ncbi:hypothetical protein DENSPDRAFT_260213 [Dentipellis sp. KUC8613]|nr:hypothetical protein DENSPDRAFT_260213 [Dentipellis sp. KUC8613]
MPVIGTAPEISQENLKSLLNQLKPSKSNLYQKDPKRIAEGAYTARSLPPSLAACPPSVLASTSTSELPTATSLVFPDPVVSATLATNAGEGPSLSVRSEAHCSAGSPVPGLNGIFSPRGSSQTFIDQPSVFSTLNSRKGSSTTSLTLEEGLASTRRRHNVPWAAVSDPSNGADQLAVDVPDLSGPVTACLPCVTTDLANRNARLILAKTRSSSYESGNPTRSHRHGGNLSSRPVDDVEELEEREVYDELAGPVFGPNLRVIGAEVGRTGCFASTIHCDISPRISC